MHITFHSPKSLHPIEGEKRKAGPTRALDQVNAENYLDVGRAMVAEFVETVQGRPEDGWQVPYAWRAS